MILQSVDKFVFAMASLNPEHFLCILTCCFIMKVAQSVIAKSNYWESMRVPIVVISHNFGQNVKWLTQMLTGNGVCWVCWLRHHCYWNKLLLWVNLQVWSYLFINYYLLLVMFHHITCFQIYISCSSSFKRDG